MTRLLYIVLLLTSTLFDPSSSCGLRLSWSGKANTYCKGRSCTDYFRWQPCGYWNPAECTCAADIATCEGGYTMSSDGTACYILRGGQTNYIDAQEICLANGDLGLARIQSDAQWTAAYSVMDSSSGGAYFGANDIASEGNYYYLDGTPVEYFRWRFRQGAQDQPRNDNKDEQDCMRLRTDSYWDDARCDRSTSSDSTKFICERKPTCGKIGTITFGIGKK